MKTLQLSLLVATAVTAQVPVFQTETRRVEIPIIARDSRNSPIADLKPHDLRLLDNGAEQSVLSLERFGGSSRQPGNANTTDDALSSRLGPRVSIIVLDILNSPRADQVHGQAAISELLRKLPQSKERVAIYVLSDSLQLLCDFTTEHDILQSVIDDYQPEELPMGALAPPPFSSGSPSGADPFHFAELRVQITLDAFRKIANRMKSLPGEKSLLWMTSGFAPPEPHSIFEVGQQLRDAKVRMYPIDARGLVACFDPCPPSVSAHIDMMEEVAQATGGRAYHDNNGLSAMARTALEDARQGYLLTYAPNNYQRDGSAHKVELQTSRKGIELRWRAGYVADAPNR